MLFSSKTFCFIDYDLYDEDDVEYGVLEHAAALRAANSVNGANGIAARSKEQPPGGVSQ